MKPLLLFCVCLVGSVWTLTAQEVGTKYSGRAEVPGLGTVEFPAGEWFLEFRRPPPTPNPQHRPDYFGFRKVAEVPERLAFQRYSPEIAAKHLSNYLDGLMESLGEGVLPEKPGYTGEEGVSYPLCFEPPHGKMVPGIRLITCSFINTKAGRPLNWLVHSRLSSKNGWAFIVSHASPSVTHPETVQDLTWISRPPE